LVILVQTTCEYEVLTEIRQKKELTLRVPTYLSRSLKVTGTDTDRSATYDFLLAIHSNHGPISYRCRDFGRISQNFPHSPCI